jgi:hypothetical protein
MKYNIMQVANLKITKINKVEEGTSKAGKAWKKLTFVGETQEQYNNLYAFELFGEEKVDNFVKFNKVGDVVDVDFNVSTREWEGRYFTSLSAWKVFKANAEAGQVPSPADNLANDLPF